VDLHSTELEVAAAAPFCGDRPDVSLPQDATDMAGGLPRAAVAPNLNGISERTCLCRHPRQDRLDLTSPKESVQPPKQSSLVAGACKQR
jgi:hypothetical protein